MFGRMTGRVGPSGTVEPAVETCELKRPLDDFRTTWITYPDGNRIELVQWPAGHADGITAADGR